MKLYLSSYRIPTPDDLADLFQKPLPDCQVALIPNAKDYKSPMERETSLDDLRRDLGAIGLKTRTIDLQPFREPEKLEGILRQFDGFFVAGGNSFLLRTRLRRSGFDKVIRPLLEEGLIYIGESAGAIVAGKSLKGFEEADTPTVVSELIYEGLGLVDKVIVPHIGSSAYERKLHTVRRQHPTDERIELADNEAYIINDGRHTISANPHQLK